MLTANFLASLQALFASQPKGREKAWDAFMKRGLPSSSSDAFKYFPLRKLYEMEPTLSETHVATDAIAPYLLPECAGQTVVFVNGRLSLELSDLSKLPSKLILLPLQEAIKTYGFFINLSLSKNLQEESDPFALLNLALYQDGLFCYLPPNLEIAAPLQLLYYGQGSYHPSRVHLFCSERSTLNTISTYVGNGLHHTALQASLEEKATWSHLDISQHFSGVHLSDFQATLKQESVLKHLSITASPSLTRHRLHVSLQGSGANALLQGLWHLSGQHQCHTHATVRHLAPLAHSLQKFKGVLQGNAQSSFEGKIYVHPEAQKTEAYQLNHNLLLGEGAIANAKPNLEIFADDVKASHGATISQVAEEELFYLQSRGLSAQVAKELLIRGFIQEMLDQISHPHVKHIIESHVFAR